MIDRYDPDDIDNIISFIINLIQLLQHFMNDKNKFDEYINSIKQIIKNIHVDWNPHKHNEIWEKVTIKVDLENIRKNIQEKSDKINRENVNRFSSGFASSLVCIILIFNIFDNYFSRFIKKN